MSSSEFCGPCAETECMEVTECESDALKTLYQRMADERPSVDCDPPRKLKGAEARAAADEAAEACGRPGVSPLKYFDVQMMAALDARAVSNADTSANDKATVPDPVLFARCKAVPAGAINAVLCGMDVERAVTGRPAERDAVQEAAEWLLMAEAACKHSGAVHAAQVAAIVQPEPKYAEDAARIGAKAYTAAARGDRPGGSTSETPVEVVGYVGCTRPPATDNAPKRNAC